MRSLIGTSSGETVCVIPLGLSLLGPTVAPHQDVSHHGCSLAPARRGCLSTQAGPLRVGPSMTRGVGTASTAGLRQLEALRRAA